MWQPLWQTIIVAIIVLAAFAVSTWKLMPARRRLRILLALDTAAARHPRLARFRTSLLQPRIKRAGGGCEGCASNVPRPPR